MQTKLIFRYSLIFSFITSKQEELDRDKFNPKAEFNVSLSDLHFAHCLLNEEAFYR